jgi:PAS domain-containing protein
MDYLKETDIIVSVCDKDGTIRYMNDKGYNYFQEPGKPELLGSNIMDCHPEPSKSRFKEMMITHETQSIIKGDGEKKRLIHQTPIYKDGEFDGYVELILPLKNLASR